MPTMICSLRLQTCSLQEAVLNHGMPEITFVKTTYMQITQLASKLHLLNKDQCTLCNALASAMT